MKLTIKLILYAGVCILFLTDAALARREKKMVQDDISNMLIEGENRLRVSGDLPPMQWAPDLYKDLPEFLRDTELLGTLNPPTLKKPPLSLPKYGLTTKTASPWLANIYEPPVLTLYTRPTAETKRVDWKFMVKDSHGKIFHERRNKGQLPDEITWSGFGGRNNPLHVGYDYSYSLLIVDQAGNPQRFAGKPFRINAFRYKKGADVITAFTPEALFQDPSSLKFSQEGVNYLTEVKDFLRLRGGRAVEIRVNGIDEKFGRARGNLIREFFIKTLDYPEQSVRVFVNPRERYNHVNIVSK